MARERRSAYVVTCALYGAHLAHRVTGRFWSVLLSCAFLWLVLIDMLHIHTCVVLSAALGFTSAFGTRLGNVSFDFWPSCFWAPAPLDAHSFETLQFWLS